MLCYHYLEVVCIGMVTFIDEFIIKQSGIQSLALSNYRFVVSYAKTDA